MPRKLTFKPGDMVVYPGHGVGQVTGVETRDFSGYDTQLYVVSFEKERMTLRIPVNKVTTSGMRRVSTREQMGKAVTALRGQARVKRTMWSRRAQEYEAKLNSGDPISVAEVVRDLHRAADQPEQSYSERQLYEAALDRLAREYAAVEKINQDDAAKRLEEVLQKAA